MSDTDDLVNKVAEAMYDRFMSSAPAKDTFMWQVLARAAVTAVRAHDAALEAQK